MIPTLILAGLAVGLLPKPWYLVAALVITLCWPVFLIVDNGTGVTGIDDLIGPFVLAAINTGVGALIARQAVRIFRAAK